MIESRESGRCMRARWSPIIYSYQLQSIASGLAGGERHEENSVNVRGEAWSRAVDMWPSGDREISSTGPASSGGADGGQDDSKEQEEIDRGDVRIERRPQHQQAQAGGGSSSTVNSQPLLSSQVGAGTSSSGGVDQQQHQQAASAQRLSTDLTWATQRQEYQRLRAAHIQAMQEQGLQSGSALPSASSAPSAAASPRPDGPPLLHSRNVINAQIREHERLREARARQSPRPPGNPAAAAGNSLEAGNLQPAPSTSLSPGLPRHAEEALRVHLQQQVRNEARGEQPTPSRQAEPDPNPSRGGGVGEGTIAQLALQSYYLALMQGTQGSGRVVACPSCSAHLFAPPEARIIACPICGQHALV